jgi:hypothetical protein
MTEAEWDDCVCFDSMLTVLVDELRFNRTRKGRRKLRLIGCAGVRRLCSDLLSDDRLARAVETSERYADDLATADELSAASVEGVPLKVGQFADQSDPTWRPRFVANVVYLTTQRNAEGVALAAAVAAWTVQGTKPFIRQIDYSATCDAVREVIGNPFRVEKLLIVKLRKRILTADVLGLAESIYEERAFDRMGILADALEDAGCEEAAVLSHCRSAGLHVRGCWVVDLILDK